MAKKIKTYRGEDINVTYDAKRCVHAAECVRGLPTVFDINKRPWAKPDQATANQVAEVVMRCPSGALQFERQDGGPQETAPAENKVVVTADGPLHFTGTLEVATFEGDVLAQGTRLALCRCGDSRNKPFCDNTHAQAAFDEPGVLGKSALKSEETVAEEDTLKITLAPDGPLLLQGSLQLQSADGQSTLLGNKTALCRCGQSQNKPFCDGTHSKVGFKAE